MDYGWLHFYKKFLTSTIAGFANNPAITIVITKANAIIFKVEFASLSKSTTIDGETIIAGSFFKYWENNSISTCTFKATVDFSEIVKSLLIILGVLAMDRCLGY